MRPGVAACHCLSQRQIGLCVGVSPPGAALPGYNSATFYLLEPAVMPNPARIFLLGPLLKGVSRSFYLTMRILPGAMRHPIGLAYLLARAADTIADTTLIPPPQRLTYLLSLREAVNGVTAVPAGASGVAATPARDDADAPDVLAKPDVSVLQRMAHEVAAQQTHSDEKLLLESLGTALLILEEMSAADQAAIRDIVTTLTQGMEFDLRTFPDEASGQLVALPDWAALDRYTYLVAGCVGEFWTRMTFTHMPGTLKGDPPEMLAQGVRFGKALQMTNVLRDCGKDVRMGRCYLPLDTLTRFGLTPEALLTPDASSRARPVLFELVRRSLVLFRDALDYLLLVPPASIRLRLACLWPIVIGLETLLLLVRNEHWLVPEKVSKVRRQQIYGIMAASVPRVVSNTALKRWCERLISEIEAHLPD
jgi:farnesyl-diphosphate farnesyltransferase